MEWLITRASPEPAKPVIRDVKLTLSPVEFFALVVVLRHVGGMRPSLIELTSKTSDWVNQINLNPNDAEVFRILESKRSGLITLEG